MVWSIALAQSSANAGVFLSRDDSSGAFYHRQIAAANVWFLRPCILSKSNIKYTKQRQSANPNPNPFSYLSSTFKKIKDLMTYLIFLHKYSPSNRCTKSSSTSKNEYHFRPDASRRLSWRRRLNISTLNLAWKSSAHSSNLSLETRLITILFLGRDGVQWNSCRIYS